MLVCVYLLLVLLGEEGGLAEELLLLRELALHLLVAARAALRLALWLYAAFLRPAKPLRRRYGAWAVVTGPTSGIGRSVALELASRGLNLVLVDLDADNLREISNTIRYHHAVQTKTVVFDLSLVSTAQGN